MNMQENRKWWFATWTVMSLASLGVGFYMRHSSSALAHSRGLEILDVCLSAIVLPAAAVLFVYRNVVTWRESPRLWWRRCRRVCWQLGVGMAVIPAPVLGYKGRWDDAAECMMFAAALLIVALAAHVRLRCWTRR